jgi:hypothetical protein
LPCVRYASFWLMASPKAWAQASEGKGSVISPGW